MRLGVALAGGGVRGCAHLGILQAFEEHGVKANMYAGSSSGSIVAAAKALGYTNKYSLQLMSKIDNKLLDIDYWGIIKHLPFKLKELESIMKGSRLHRFLDDNFSLPIYQVKTPLSVISSDLVTSAQVIFSSKKIPVDPLMDDIIKVYTSVTISEALKASSAIPGIYPSRSYLDHKLIDGSVVNHMPVNVLTAMGAEKTIGINLSQKSSRRDPKGIIDNLIGSIGLLISQNVDLSLLYNPNHLTLGINLDDIGMFEFDKAQECYDRGYKFGRSMIEDIWDFLDA